MSISSDEEVFQDGRDAYNRGWLNVPPYSISILRPRHNGYIGTASIWMNGWKAQKEESDNANA